MKIVYTVNLDGALVACFPNCNRLLVAAVEACADTVYASKINDSLDRIGELEKSRNWWSEHVKDWRFMFDEDPFHGIKKLYMDDHLVIIKWETINA